MTVNYMHQAANADIKNFIMLMFRWRASVWKSVWHDLLGFLAVYYIISFIYHGILINTVGAIWFEQAVKYCTTLHSSSATVLTFADGFYVTQIYNRWWAVFMMIPWPDNFCLEMCAYLRTRGRIHKKEDCLIRTNIMRYINLSFVLTFRDISERIMQRFPTYDHLKDMMTAEERRRLEKCNPQRRYWMPLEWVLMTLRQCYNQKQIDEIHFSRITQSVVDFREKLHNVMQYDWVNVPLVYTQVVQLCTLSFFLLRLLTAQVLLPNEKDTWLDGIPIPFYAIFEFVFFVGWLKCAQVMINPFGMDDDDFDIDTIIERNVSFCYSAMDNMFDNPPKLADIRMKGLPHTLKSAVERELHKMNPMIGSATVLEVSRENMKVVHDLPIANASLRKPLAVVAGSESNTTVEVSPMDKTVIPTPTLPTAPAKTEKNPSKRSNETCKEIPNKMPSTQNQPPSTQKPASTQREPSSTERRKKSRKSPPKTPRTSIALPPEGPLNMDATIDANEMAKTLDMWAKVQKKRKKMDREKDEEESRTQSNSDSQKDERPMGTPVGSSLRAASTQMGPSEKSSMDKMKTKSRAPSFSLQSTPDGTLALSPPKPSILKKSGTNVSRQSSNDGKRPPEKSRVKSTRKQTTNLAKKSNRVAVPGLASSSGSKMDKSAEASGVQQGSKMRKTSDPSVVGKKKSVSQEPSKSTSSANGKKKSKSNLNTPDFMRKLAALKAIQEQQNAKQAEDPKKK